MVPQRPAQPTAAPWGTYVVELGAMTIEAFAQLPLVDHFVFDLYGGRLIRMPGPTIAQAIVHSNFFRVLARELDAAQFGKVLGRCCYHLPLPRDTETLLCCDLSYVQPIRLLNAKKRGLYVTLAPELVVLIAPPQMPRDQMAAKARVCLQAGVRLLWMAWPGERTIDMWLPGEEPVTLGMTDVLESDVVIPRFAAPVSAFFEGLEEGVNE